MPSSSTTTVTPSATAAAADGGVPAASTLWDVPPEEGESNAEDLIGAKGWEPSRQWRPVPWCWVPDWVAGVLGLLVLLPVAPFMAVLIGTGELSMALCLWVHRHSRGLFPALGRVVQRACATLGAHVLRDPRNADYLPWMIFLLLWAPSLFLWAMYRTATQGFDWTFFFVYHFLRIGPRFRFFARIHVLVHKEGHDHAGFFKPPFTFLNQLNQWVIGPFYGQVPNSYSIAHNKIHHQFHNALDDVHTNLDLDRTKPWSFVVYLPRFVLYWTGISPLIHFLYHREWKFARHMFQGMLAYYGGMAALCYWNPVFGLAYCIFPNTEDFIFFGGISYMWHCFLEPTDPFNQYVNSVTILKGKDNIWNEDFHVVHHHSPGTHWTDIPKHYQAHVELYRKYQATIFEDCEQGEMLFWLLAKKWDLLAQHFVDLNGKMTVEQKRELIIRRLSYTVGKAQDEEGAKAKAAAAAASLKASKND